MDALSFVLGVQSRALRSSQMKDLIFRPPGKNRTKLRASAAIYFDTDDGETIKFQRTIGLNGHGDYRINNEVVSYKQYEERLGEIGVLVKARNFLVFQGDVESLARKTPAEFVNLIEQISLSVELKDEYEKALKTKEEAEASTLFCFNKQKGMKGERRLLKEQKEEAEKFHQLLEEKQGLQTDFYLWQLFHMEEERKRRETKLEELKTELEQKVAEEQAKQTLVKEAKKEASAARRKTEAADKKRMAVQNEVSALQEPFIKVEKEISSLERKIEKNKKELGKTKANAEKHGDTLQGIDTRYEEAKEALASLEQEYEESRRDVAPDDVTLTQEQEEELSNLKDEANTATVQLRKDLGRANKQLESARARSADIKEQHDQLKNRKTEISRDMDELEDRIEKLEKVGFCIMNMLWLRGSSRLDSP